MIINTLWLPFSALVVVAIAVALVAVAYSLTKHQWWIAAAGLVVLAALVLRSYAGADKVLYPWDERYHALVAKHLIDNPFVPTLYEHPPLPVDFTKWTSNHVWLHKPPMALWAMASSMKLFGISEYAMRLPGILASVLALAVTFQLGRILFTPSAGLLAAVFQAFNGFLTELAAGRRASDHVDTLLILIVEAGVLAGLTLERRGRFSSAVAIGLATGFACLTKSFSGLILLAIWAVMRVHSRPLVPVLRELTIASALALLVAAPWTIYTARAFPLESAFERTYALRHISEVLEDQGGPPWQYIKDMPRFFGELIMVPLAWGLFSWWRGTASPSRRLTLAWIAVPYVLYSSVATKMPAYVMVAAPAIFLLEAECLLELWNRVGFLSSGRRKMALTAALIITGLLPARQLLEPTGPLERRDGNPQWVRDLRSLNERIGKENAVVFNVQHPIEAMFYTPFVAYEYLPTDDQIEQVLASGFRVYIYDDNSTSVPAPVNTRVTLVHPSR